LTQERLKREAQAENVEQYWEINDDNEEYSVLEDAEIQSRTAKDMINRSAEQFLVIRQNIH